MLEIQLQSIAYYALKDLCLYYSSKLRKIIFSEIVERLWYFLKQSNRKFENVF